MSATTSTGLALRLRVAFFGPPLPFTTFALFRRALHVQAEDPGRSTSHDHLDDRVTARVATLLRRDDEAPLGERVRVITTGILRAANETLSVRPVADHEFSIPAFFAAADEVPLPDRWTIGCDAVRRRAAAVRVF